MSKRIQFFLGHLLVSLLFAFCAICIVFFIWYPNPLAKALGVTHIFLLLISIDVIVGPLFTLLLYKPNKKGLKFDLTIVILIQVMAFSYGFYSIAQGRPAWIVFYADRFELVRVNDIISNSAHKANPRFEKPSWFGPQYVAVKSADTREQRQQDIFLEVLGGLSIAQYPERYLAFDDVKTELRSKGQKLIYLEKFNSNDDVKRIMHKYPNANGWLPLHGKDQDMIVLINMEKAQLIGIADLRPWI